MAKQSAIAIKFRISGAGSSALGSKWDFTKIWGWHGGLPYGGLRSFEVKKSGKR
ncbi:MAG: hypothetical protein MUO22_01350 [Sedimentisphaerales bacterium]|nr:hypothetical protein [Sedimentisphaerales bacterium]